MLNSCAQQNSHKMERPDAAGPCSLQDWITTLVTLSPESVSYLDFVEEGRRLAFEPSR